VLLRKFSVIHEDELIVGSDLLPEAHGVLGAT
jgi:hypothetical protein